MPNFQGSPQESAPTRAMASLLEEFRPQQLDELRKKFSNAAALFDTSYELGVQSSTAFSQNPEANRQGALLALISATHETASAMIDPILAALTRRMLLARRARLIGSLIATTSSAGVVASLVASFPKLGLIVSVATLGGSVTGLLGEHLEKPLVGGQQSLSDLLVEATQIEASLNEVHVRLLTDDTGDMTKLIDLTKTANQIAANTKRICVFAGIPIQKTTK